VLPYASYQHSHCHQGAFIGRTRRDINNRTCSTVLFVIFSGRAMVCTRVTLAHSMGRYRKRPSRRLAPHGTFSEVIGTGSRTSWDGMRDGGHWLSHSRGRYRKRPSRRSALQETRAAGPALRLALHGTFSKVLPHRSHFLRTLRLNALPNAQPLRLHP
jgi:hypothetical protein